MDKKVINALKERYSKIHPLIFYRSLEKSKTCGELFDILESFPNEYPVIWDTNLKKWIFTKDIFQSNNFEKNMEKI